MGVEEGWHEVLARHRPPLLHRLRRDDRGGVRRRQSLIMLVAGAVLALAAVILARSTQGARTAAAQAAVPTVTVVAAAADIGFGEKVTPEKLKLVELPAQTLPTGHFTQLDKLVQPPGHTAMRPIAANEVLTAQALAAGATRLSTAPLLNPKMRALSVPVDEVSGVAGLLYPGDRVDIFLTEQPDEAQPHAELLAQDIRVLAVGEDMNIARDKPGVVKSATLELTPAQVQKLTLGVATGTIRLTLRHFSDHDRIRLESLQLRDLNDGTTTRLVRKPSGSSSAPPATRPAPATVPSVTVIRGGAATQVPVLP